MLVIAISIGALGDAIWAKIYRFVYRALVALDAVESSSLYVVLTVIADVAIKVMSRRTHVNQENLLGDGLTESFEERDRTPKIQIIRVCRSH
jgi:hypothetical protein